MKLSKIFLVILMLVCVACASFASASCTEDNAFTLGDEVNVCSNGCIYQNDSNLSQYIACDSSVTCLFSAFYENGTLIVSNGAMDRDGVIFNYSLGNLTTSGVYTGQIYCYREKGWMPPIAFPFSISSVVLDSPQGQKSVKMEEKLLPQLREEIKESYLGKILDFVKRYGVWMILLLVFLIYLFGRGKGNLFGVGKKKQGVLV